LYPFHADGSAGVRKHPLLGGGMEQNPNTSLDPAVRRWIENMFRALGFGQPMFVEGRAQQGDGGSSFDAGMLRQEFQRRLDARPTPPGAAPLEASVLEATRLSLAEAIAKSATPDALMRLEPRIVEFETAVQGVAEAVEKRAQIAQDLAGHLRERDRILSGATGAPPPLDGIFAVALKDSIKVAMLLSPPLSDQGLADAQSLIDAPLQGVTGAFSKSLERLVDPGVPTTTSVEIEKERERLRQVYATPDLASMIEALPALAEFDRKVDEANRQAAEERRLRVEKATALRERAQKHTAAPPDADEVERQGFVLLLQALPKLSTTDPPVEALNLFEQALLRLEESADTIGKAVQQRREAVEKAVLDLSEAKLEPDLAADLAERLGKTRDDLALALKGVPAAAALPSLLEKVKLHVEEVVRENAAVLERRKVLTQALDLLKLDAEMPQTECAELRLRLTAAVSGAAKRPAEPSLAALEQGLADLKKAVEEANLAFDQRRKRAEGLRGEVTPLKVPEAGAPEPRKALEEDRTRILKALEGVPTTQAMDELGGPIGTLKQKIAEMEKWVVEQTARRDLSLRTARKDLVWPGFSPAQAKHLRDLLAVQEKAAAELWKLDAIVPEIEKVGQTATQLRTAVEPLVRRLTLIPANAPPDSLPDEQKQWTDLRKQASDLIAAVLAPAVTGAPAAVLSLLESLEKALPARIQARKASITTLDTQKMGVLSTALGGSEKLARLVDSVPKAQLDKILTAFKGQETKLADFIQNVLGSDPAMLDGMLRLGCDGDAGKLKTLIEKFPGGDAAKNLSGLILSGGLNGRPEVLSAILKTGCNGDPAKFAAFVNEMKKPEDQKRLAELLGTGGLGGSPQTLGGLVKDGSASRIKSLGNQFGTEDKQKKLANLVGKGGLGDGFGQDPRTLSKMLDDPGGVTMARLEQMANSFDGANAEKLRVMIAAFNGTPDPTKDPKAAKRIKSLMKVFNNNPDRIRDTFFGTIDKENRGSSAVSSAGKGAAAGTETAASKAILGTDPGLVQASLTANLPAADADRIAAGAPGLTPDQRAAILDAQALARHSATDAEALGKDGTAGSKARDAAIAQAKALVGGAREPVEGEINDAVAAADKAAQEAEDAARKLAASLSGQRAALTPAQIAEAAQQISATVAAARGAVNDDRRTKALEAAELLRKAMAAAMQRHAANLLATSAAPGVGDAVKAGVAADEAARALAKAGILPDLRKALEETAAAALTAALAGAQADAVGKDPNAKKGAEAAAARAATAATGVAPPAKGEVTKALQAAADRAKAARDSALTLAAALANAPPPVDPGLIKRTAAAAETAGLAAAEAADDTLRAETVAAAKAAAKAAADAALRLAAQAQGRAAVTNVDSAPSVKAGFDARGALEALENKPNVTAGELDDMRKAIAAGDRAAVMQMQAKALADDAVTAKARAVDAARQAAEAKAGGPVGQGEIDAAALEANNAADTAALKAEQEKNALAVLNPPTADQIDKTQVSAEAAIKAAALATDDGKRANALAKAREAMAAGANTPTAIAPHSTAQQAMDQRGVAKTKTTVGVQSQRNIEGDVMVAIDLTAQRYPFAHYNDNPITRQNAQHDIDHARDGYSGARATKISDMDEAKEATAKATTALLRNIAANDEPSRTAALELAKARVLADLPGATPEQMRDAVKAEADLAKAIAAKAKADATLGVNNLVHPTGATGMPAPVNAFVSTAASPDALMRAALSLKAAVAAAAERVDAAVRAHSAAVQAHQKKNTSQTLTAQTNAKQAVTDATNALVALKPTADMLKRKAEDNVYFRYDEYKKAGNMTGGTPIWRQTILQQCTDDLEATKDVASMLALIVAQSFSGGAPNLATTKGRDALLDEAGKFALVPIGVAPKPGEVPNPHKADMVHFSDRHAYEHCSFDPETVYYPDEMEDIIMFDMRDQPFNRSDTDLEGIMREKKSFAKVNGFWPEGTTKTEMSIYLGRAIQNINSYLPVNPPPRQLVSRLALNNVANAKFPSFWGISPRVANVAPDNITVDVVLSARRKAGVYTFGQFFPKGMPLTGFFDMATIKKGLGK
jgi:hypothetical protein